MKNPYSQFHKTGHFSWVYNNYSDTHNRKCVDVQWLMFQGSEFRVFTDNPHEFVNKIAKHFGLEAKVTYNLWSQKSTSITTEQMTLSPEDILSVDPNAEIVITFFSKYQDKRRKFKHFDSKWNIID